MSAMRREDKIQLGELLAQGHSKFGRVKDRMPYRDDDGDAGGSELRLETHPLLEDVPVGASSDLTAVVSQYRDALQEAVERVDDASIALRHQPALQQALSQRFGHSAAPTLTRK